jgi:hypothetical protein
MGISIRKNMYMMMRTAQIEIGKSSASNGSVMGKRHSISAVILLLTPGRDAILAMYHIRSIILEADYAWSEKRIVQRKRKWKHEEYIVKSYVHI